MDNVFPYFFLLFVKPSTYVVITEKKKQINNLNDNEQA